MTLSSRLMSIAFISGGIFTLTSPASYSRIGFMLQPEHPAEMLLLSAGYVLILLAATVVTFAGRRQQTPALCPLSMAYIRDSRHTLHLLHAAQPIRRKDRMVCPDIRFDSTVPDSRHVAVCSEKGTDSSNRSAFHSHCGSLFRSSLFPDKNGNESAKAIGIYRNSPTE